ncbi:Os02g0828300 [Oryza sativa Japonica Group]|jgi:hypothetical protein|uniref:Os02g0828300 protein n=1 Tax=Oryza sativa subsp. japonica TaxID=39947 RepID=Q6K7P7_ORYSJ|nr:unknown protein [Oryza sativa Japonica Group]BAF10514.1 Os02g0828300 [Oryza sativa Japonica Group]|eukprot:NP_001048600.1 Os02g0828300 [Oryza sativa Japonica Group]
MTTARRRRGRGGIEGDLAAPPRRRPPPAAAPPPRAVALLLPLALSSLPAPGPLPSSLALLAKVAVVLARCSRRLLAGERRWLLLRRYRSRRIWRSRCLGHCNAGGNMLWNLYLLSILIPGTLVSVGTRYLWYRLIPLVPGTRLVPSIWYRVPVISSTWWPGGGERGGGSRVVEQEKEVARESGGRRGEAWRRQRRIRWSARRGSR